MRACAGALSLVGALLACAAAVADEFPYTAYVNAADVYVRSGPGRNYYPTDKLAAGDAVEVYRHDPGGWYAVRPPEGSFSWVSARSVEPGDDGLGTISEDRVVSRIGSKFSSLRDVIQVRLDRGERVELLGESNSGGQTWYKVAPPAGEFRWINAQFLSRQSQDGLSMPRRNDDDDSNIAEDNDAVAREHETRLVGYTELAKRRHPENDAPTDGLSKPFHRLASADIAPRHRPVGDEKAREQFLELELQAIDREVSRMVAEEPTVWNFQEVRIRAEGLLEDTTTAIERGRVRKTLNSIARFEDIRQRYQSVSDILAKTDEENGKLAADVERRQRSLATAVRSDGSTAEFDGQGVLRPVVSKRPEAPRYALVDDSGLVLSFVSPAPGINLQPYIGQKIGLQGSRGYMPELGKAHIMAQRVTGLDSAMR